MALPRELVVSSRHRMVNLTASLSSRIACSRVALASSGTRGMTSATKSLKAWVYQVKRHAVFTDRKAKLELEKISF